MEISSVIGPKAADVTAARLPTPIKKAAEGESRPVQKAEMKPGKEHVQQDVQRRPVAPVSSRSGTRMTVDEESRRWVAQIMGLNNEVIKQIPPEELLKLSARMRRLRGQLFDETV